MKTGAKHGILRVLSGHFMGTLRVLCGHFRAFLAVLSVLAVSWFFTLLSFRGGLFLLPVPVGETLIVGVHVSW